MKTGKKLKDFKSSWWSASERAGIKDFHFHDVHRSFATELFDICEREFSPCKPLWDIQTSGRREIYAHVKDEDLLRQLNKVSERLYFQHYPIFTPLAKNANKDRREKPASPYLSGIKWSGRDDLNIRPLGPEPNEKDDNKPKEQ